MRAAGRLFAREIRVHLEEKTPVKPLVGKIFPVFPVFHQMNVRGRLL